MRALGRLRGRAALRRHYSVCSRCQAGLAKAQEDDSIAIIGGGVTGLTAAYYLARELPRTTTITLYESSNRLGGWLESKRVPVDLEGKSGHVTFERGPRILRSLASDRGRFDDLVLWDLVANLGLRVIPRKGPLARYIYRDRLLRPKDIMEPAIQEKLGLNTGAMALNFIGYSIMRRLRQWVGWLDPAEDMSLGQFVRNATGSEEFVDNVASALVHGIWGGHIDSISARTLGKVWGLNHAHTVNRNRSWVPAGGTSPGDQSSLVPLSDFMLLSDFSDGFDPDNPAFKDLSELIQKTFGAEHLLIDGGMEAIPQALEAILRLQDNIEIRKNTSISNIKYDEDLEEVLVTAGGVQTGHDHVISTIFSKDLARIAGPGVLPSLESSRAVSIMAVNLWYPRTGLIPEGVGHLIPLGEPNNPEHALGVMYDSNILEKPQDEPEGTKLFVLLGGHYYDDHPIPSTEDEAIQQARRVVERQLNIPMDVPYVATAGLARNCIPQHDVGHGERLAYATDDLYGAFQRRLLVAGTSYNAIGILGAMRAGYEVAAGLIPDYEASIGVTGLSFAAAEARMGMRFLPVADKWLDMVRTPKLSFAQRLRKFAN